MSRTFWGGRNSVSAERNSYDRRIFQTAAPVCAYAWATIISPKEQQVQFHIGYDEVVSVWLNGEWRFEAHGGNPVVIDDGRFDGLLQPGRNQLLVRITNLEPGWGFILRVTGNRGEVMERRWRI